MVWDKQHQVGVTESRGLLAERVRIKDKKQTTKQKPQIPPPPQTKQNNQEKTQPTQKLKELFKPTAGLMGSYSHLPFGNYIYSLWLRVLDVPWRLMDFIAFLSWTTVQALKYFQVRASPLLWTVLHSTCRYFASCLNRKRWGPEVNFKYVGYSDVCIIPY